MILNDEMERIRKEGGVICFIKALQIFAIEW
jgi:hypothetical protein